LGPFLLKFALGDVPVTFDFEFIHKGTKHRPAPATIRVYP
jgi:hypothetical protein